MNRIIKIISILIALAIIIAVALSIKNQSHLENSKEEITGLKEQVLGKGDLEIIVYEDLSDFYSFQYNETLKLIREKYSDQLRIVFKPYANKMFKMSYPVHSFVACASEQGKFFSARDLIFSKLETDSLDLNDFLAYGQELELDNDSLNLCLKEERYLNEIEKLFKEALDSGIYGSPSTIVGDEIVLGARSFEDSVNSNGENLPGLKSIIERHLSN
ncbi:MAG: DsbA family protein [Patescibacteria group bacterium]|jgi:protein-disulfide isomerase|nr:thioredoxin domain-containing protein [Patescibacteria group bacterium]